MKFQICDFCGSRDKRPKACSRCVVAMYCSPQCQRAAWPMHREECKRMAVGSPGDAVATVQTTPNGSPTGAGANKKGLKSAVKNQCLLSLDLIHRKVEEEVESWTDVDSGDEEDGDVVNKETGERRRRVIKSRPYDGEGGSSDEESSSVDDSGPGGKFACPCCCHSSMDKVTALREAMRRATSLKDLNLVLSDTFRAMKDIHGKIRGYVWPLVACRAAVLGLSSNPVKGLEELLLVDLIWWFECNWFRKNFTSLPELRDAVSLAVRVLRPVFHGARGNDRILQKLDEIEKLFCGRRPQVRRAPLVMIHSVARAQEPLFRLVAESRRRLLCGERSRRVIQLIKDAWDLDCHYTARFFDCLSLMLAETRIELGASPSNRTELADLLGPVLEDKLAAVAGNYRKKKKAAVREQELKATGSPVPRSIQGAAWDFQHREENFDCLFRIAAVLGKLKSPGTDRLFQDMLRSSSRGTDEFVEITRHYAQFLLFQQNQASDALALLRPIVEARFDGAAVDLNFQVLFADCKQKTPGQAAYECYQSYRQVHKTALIAAADAAARTRLADESTDDGESDAPVPPTYMMVRLAADVLTQFNLHMSSSSCQGNGGGGGGGGQKSSPESSPNKELGHVVAFGEEAREQAHSLLSFNHPLIHDSLVPALAHFYQVLDRPDKMVQLYESELELLDRVGPETAWNRGRTDDVRARYTLLVKNARLLVKKQHSQNEY